MPTRTLLVITSMTLLLVGCYNPRGAFYPYVGQAATYWSTEMKPTTITIVDTRTREPFFTVEIPVGKQLVIDFKEGAGDNDVLTPDLMRYEIFEVGKTSGTLRNAITVPDRFSRRIDVDYRPAPEYAQAPADQQDRVDKDQADWWSSKGGSRPGNTAIIMHDGK